MTPNETRVCASCREPIAGGPWHRLKRKMGGVAHYHSGASEVPQAAACVERAYVAFRAAGGTLEFVRPAGRVNKTRQIEGTNDE
jgi:hypothetical protein